MSTTILIRDEATRRAVESILWNHACRVEGERLNRDLSDLGDSSTGLTLSGRHDENREAVDETLDVLLAARRLVDSLRVGQPVILPIEPSGVRDLLDDMVLPAIEEYGERGYVDGGFFNQPPEVRETLLATRDAARGVLKSLSVGEAVA